MDEEVWILGSRGKMGERDSEERRKRKLWFGCKIINKKYSL